MKRKLPDRATVNRLYWYDEISTTEIAQRYNMRRDAVTQGMRRMGIPRRRPGDRRYSICVECPEPVCLIWRRPYGRKPFYSPTDRCAVHFHREERRRYREQRRRLKGTPESRWKGPGHRALGNYWRIHPDDRVKSHDSTEMR